MWWKQVKQNRLIVALFFYTTHEPYKWYIITPICSLWLPVLRQPKFLHNLFASAKAVKWIQSRMLSTNIFSFFCPG